MAYPALAFPDGSNFYQSSAPPQHREREPKVDDPLSGEVHRDFELQHYGLDSTRAWGGRAARHELGRASGVSAKANEAKELMLRKNHDYGEAWRDMRVSSFTDLIIQKLLRVKQIEDNQGKTLISEGLEANYLDMVNYSGICAYYVYGTRKIIGP